MHRFFNAFLIATNTRMNWTQLVWLVCVVKCICAFSAQQASLGLHTFYSFNFFSCYYSLLSSFIMSIASYRVYVFTFSIACLSFSWSTLPPADTIFIYNNELYPSIWLTHLSIPLLRREFLSLRWLFLVLFISSGYTIYIARLNRTHLNFLFFILHLSCMYIEKEDGKPVTAKATLSHSFSSPKGKLIQLSKV